MCVWEGGWFETPQLRTNGVARDWVEKNVYAQATLLPTPRIAIWWSFGYACANFWFGFGGRPRSLAASTRTLSRNLRRSQPRGGNRTDQSGALESVMEKKEIANTPLMTAQGHKRRAHPNRLQRRNRIRNPFKKKKGPIMKGKKIHIKIVGEPM